MAKVRALRPEMLAISQTRRTRWAARWQDTAHPTYCDSVLLAAAGDLEGARLLAESASELAELSRELHSLRDDA